MPNPCLDMNIHSLLLGNPQQTTRKGWGRQGSSLGMKACNQNASEPQSSSIQRAAQKRVQSSPDELAQVFSHSLSGLQSNNGGHPHRKREENHRKCLLKM